MNISPGISDRLRANENVSALVGDRIYPVLIPRQDTDDPLMPCITFEVRYEMEEALGFDGQSSARVSIRVRCWSDSYDDSHQLADAALAALASLTDYVSGDCRLQSLSGSSIEDGSASLSPNQAYYLATLELNGIAVTLPT